MSIRDATPIVLDWLLEANGFALESPTRLYRLLDLPRNRVGVAKA